MTVSLDPVPQAPPAPPTPAAAQAAGPDPAAVLQGEGTTIRMWRTDYQSKVEVQLRYTMASLAQIEREHGSLVAIGDALAAMQPAAGADPAARPDPGAIFTKLAGLLAPGLLHVRVTHPDTNQVVRIGKDPELCGELLDPAELQAYMAAFMSAISESFGELMQGTPQPAGQGEQIPASPGPAGTTSAPSTSADPIGSSGA